MGKYETLFSKTSDCHSRFKRYGGQSYQIEICSDIIAWAEKQESDEATAIYWIAHDCLTEVMK